VSWYDRVRRQRPWTVLGVACDMTDAEVRALSAAPFSIAPVLSPRDAPGGVVPNETLGWFLRGSIEGRIRECLTRDLGCGSEDDNELLSVFVAHAVRGGTLAGVARDIGVTERTVARRFRGLTDCPAKCLLRRARITAVELQGSSDRVGGAVLASAGFRTRGAFEKARSRDRRRMDTRSCPVPGSTKWSRCPFFA
jgi:AraC-like DNA-binding protein